MITEPYNDSTIMNFLDHIDESSDYEAFQFIKKKYGDVIFELYENRQRYNDILINSKFLSILYQVIYTINIDAFNKMCCDSLLYYIITSLHPNEYIKGLVFMLGELINKTEIEALKQIKNLDYELLVFLAITNHSNSNDIERVSRVNFTLCTSSKYVLTCIDLRYIYAALYSKEFTALIMGTVFDTTIERGIDNEEPWITPIVEGTNRAIKDLLLWILENLDMSSLNHYLRLIADEFARRSHNEYTVSMSFKNLDYTHYKKICIMVEQLQSEGIDIP